MDNFQSFASLGDFSGTTPIEDQGDIPSTEPMGEFSSPPTAATPTYDIRQQIVANALVIFPTIAIEYAKKFPTIPVHAEDIFNVRVLIVDKTDPNNAPDGSFRAKLTHTNGDIVAIRKLLLTSNAMSTAGEALENLLEATARALGSNHKTPLRHKPSVRVPEGVFEMLTSTPAGSENNGNTIHQEVGVGGNMGKIKDRTLTKALWQKCRKAMQRGQAR